MNIQYMGGLGMMNNRMKLIYKNNSYLCKKFK